MSEFRGSADKASSILNLNVRSVDQLTSHPPSWTRDPIWNGGRPALLTYLGLRHYVIALGYETAYKWTVQVQFPAGIFGTLLSSGDTHWLTYCVMCVGVFF